MTENGLYECHGHILMNGIDYLQAKHCHEAGPVIGVIREELRALHDAGVVYFRDGGDALGVSAAARKLAPEYGIEYVTPLFAIHRKGYYGGIVGHGYSDMDGYRALVTKAREEGADFIKIMISGIITFKEYGDLSCPSLAAEEIKTLVGIAHDAGFSVMIHGNGDAAVRAAVLAGAESIEHGAFLEKETLGLLAGSKTVWVPTAAAIAAFTKRDEFDRSVAERILEKHLENIRYASEEGALIAAGSDSGAAGVPHGGGTIDEYRLLAEAGLTDEQIGRGNAAIREKFCDPGRKKV